VYGTIEVVAVRRGNETCCSTEHGVGRRSEYGTLTRMQVSVIMPLLCSVGVAVAEGHLLLLGDT
jgi:hypothetical protein